MVRISITAVCLLAMFFGASTTAQPPENTRTTNGESLPSKLTIAEAIDEAVCGLGFERSSFKLMYETTDK